MPEAEEFRLRKAWRVSIEGYDTSDIFYAPSAGKARMALWRRLDHYESITRIRVRRVRHLDKRLPVRDPTADTLSKDELHCLMHSFGGYNPDRAGHRDYFYTYRDDKHLVGLSEKGLTKPMAGEQWGPGMTYFILTPKGKQVALSLVHTYC